MLRDIIYISLFFVCGAYSAYEDLYYWKQYNGVIPKDAVVGGLTCNGKKTYIGSTLFLPNGLLPSTIYEDDEFTYSFADGIERKSNTVIKILCASTHPPEWISVNISNIPKDCHFIEAGAEYGFPLYIGRINIKGLYYTGKVFPPESFLMGLSVWNDRVIESISKFEMLGYCKKNETKLTSKYDYEFITKQNQIE